MLKRIYIDNFRCLTNFELNISEINLILGSNGVGKSTVFDVLRKIQEFVRGDSKLDSIFPINDCTRWQISSTQRFEIEIFGNGGNYRYELGIGHDRNTKFSSSKNRCRVEYERLWFDNQPLLKFELGEVKLYRDNHSEGPTYSFDWSQSMLPSLMPRNDNTKLTWFKERVAKFIIVKTIPCSIEDESSEEAFYLTENADNYVSWYRNLSEDQGKVAYLGNILKDILDGFISFKFERVSEQNILLKLKFSNPEIGVDNLEYRFGEMSDGQKALIVLYTLIYGTKSEDYTLCIDEPENFLALPEIQPWLTQLYDLCSDGQLQALLISHHPELINYLLASPIGYWFERQSNAPVRVKQIDSDVAQDSGLPISELIARGWLHESA